ncbi:unnamed protein product, partial [Cylicostephanus goldi]
MTKRFQFSKVIRATSRRALSIHTLFKIAQVIASWISSNYGHSSVEKYLLFNANKQALAIPSNICAPKELITEAGDQKDQGQIDTVKLVRALRKTGHCACAWYAAPAASYPRAPAGYAAAPPPPPASSYGGSSYGGGGGGYSAPIGGGGGYSGPVGGGGGYSGPVGGGYGGAAPQIPGPTQGGGQYSDLGVQGGTSYGQGGPAPGLDQGPAPGGSYQQTANVGPTLVQPAPQTEPAQQFTSQESAPQEQAPQEQAPQEQAPQEQISQEQAPQEPAPQEAAPEEPASFSAPAPSGTYVNTGNTNDIQTAPVDQGPPPPPPAPVDQGPP